MSEAVSREMDGKVIKIYHGGEHVPVIYSNDYGESGAEVRQCCEKLGCPSFHLVTVSKVGWDSSMSPWPSEPVVAKNDHFTGNAPGYLKWFLENVIPYAEEALELKDPVSYLAGYSMAGLFALWSLYQTDYFSGAVCASGSLWYPGFCDFALNHKFRKTPSGIYLSLGDKESSVRNPAVQNTESIFRILDDHYRRNGIFSVFELNPGNHYRDMVLRMARGYRWILTH